MIDQMLDMFTSLGPGVWSLIVGVIGVIGVFLAVVSLKGIGKESRILRKANYTLTAKEAWVGSSPGSKAGLDKWLGDKSIVEDSHVGDFIEACWSSQQGGKTATLSELHALVPRRQRSYWPVRLSGGIAALLLVMGIVGTLASIHPILKGFKFEITSDGSLRSEKKPDVPDADNIEADSTSGDVGDTVGKVNKLINGLGDAFKPSLMALFFTVLVVSCRGGYSIKLYKFSKELDQFATGVLIPNFRAASLAKQYEDVKKSLEGVAESILTRERKFEEAIAKLGGFLEGLPVAIKSLQDTTENSNNAANRLAEASDSVSASLTNNLGEGSPLLKAITNLEGVYSLTDESLVSFQSLVKNIKKSNDDSCDTLTLATNDLKKSVGEISEEQKDGREQVVKSIGLLNDSMVEVPKLVKKDASLAVSKGVDEFKIGLNALSEDVKDAHKDTTDELKEQTIEVAEEVGKLSGSIDSAGSGLADVRKKVENAGDALSGIPGVVAGVAKESVDQGVVEFKKGLVVLGEDMKDAHKDTTGELKEQTIEVAREVGKLSGSISSVGSELADLKNKVEDAGDTLSEMPSVVAGAVKESLDQGAVEFKKQTAEPINEIKKASSVLTGKLEQAEARMRDVVPEIAEGIKKTASQSVDEQVKKLDEPIEIIGELSKTALDGGETGEGEQAGKRPRKKFFFSRKDKN